MVSVITRIKDRKGKPLKIVQNVRTFKEAERLKKFIGKTGKVEIIGRKRKKKSSDDFGFNPKLWRL